MLKVTGILKKRFLAVPFVMLLVCAVIFGVVFVCTRFLGLGFTAETVWELCALGVCAVMMFATTRIYNKKLGLFLNVGCTRAAWFAAMQLQKILLCVLGTALMIGVSYAAPLAWKTTAPCVPLYNHIMLLCGLFVLASLGELAGAICARGTRLGLLLYLLPAAAFGVLLGVAVATGVVPLFTQGLLIAATNFVVVPCAVCTGAGLVFSIIAWFSMHRCEA